MPRSVLADELVVTVRVPADMPGADLERVRRVLASRRFLARLGKAVRTAVRSFPDLAPVSATVTR